MAYNFPNSPINGDTYLDYVWDTEKWILAAGGQPATAPPVPSNVYDPATGLAAPVTQVAVDVDALAASFAANTISIHGTNPAGTTFSATNWTSPSTSLKYATPTNTYNFLFAGKYHSRDHTLTGWFKNGEVFLRYVNGKAWVFQLNHEGTGSLNILLCQGLAQGVSSPIRTSATETYYAYGGTTTLNADIAAKIPGFDPNDTEGHKQKFEVAGLELAFWYSLDGVSFTEIVRVTPLNSATWLHMADGTVAIGNLTGYGWRDFTIDYNASPAALYSNFTTTLDVRDFGVKDVETTGSMTAGSPTLTVASAANLNIGDYVIVDTFGATGAGAQGGRGPGGQWPALRYADVTAMNADLSKPVNTACSLTSTGDVWHFDSAAWVRDATWNPAYSYMHKSSPMALRARIIGKSGLTLTLDANAVVAVTASRVYHDNAPRLAFLADTQDFHVTVPSVEKVLPDSRIVMGAALNIFAHPGWSLRGAGSGRANSTPTGLSRLWAPLGCPGPEINVSNASSYSVKDLFIDSGGYLTLPQIDAANMAQDAYNVIWPHALMFTLCSNITVDNLKVTQVFQQAVGFRYCNNATVSNCFLRMTDPLAHYIQWMYQTANSTNITYIDCEMDSDWMMTFCEPFADNGARFIRCIARNGISSNNTAINTEYTDLGVVMEAMSRYSYDSQHVQNPVLQSNSNIGPGSPSAMVVNRFRLLLEGYVDAANEQPKGIVLTSSDGSVVSNSNMEMLPYHASSTLNGAQGIVCDSSDCTISAVRVDGTTIGSWAGNITAYTGTGTDIVNCIADRQTNTQTGGTVTGDQTIAAAGTDRIPTDVSFTPVFGAVVGQTYISNEIIISGVNALLQNVTLTSNAKLLWLGDGVVPPVGNGTVRDHDHWVRKILRDGDRLKLQAVAGAGVTSVVLQLASGKTYTWTITTDLYPDAVESAGAEVAWNLRNTTGYRPANLIKTIGSHGVPSGWTTESVTNGTRLRTTAINATLEGYDLSDVGYGVNIVHANATVRDCKFDLSPNAAWSSGGFNAVINISTSQTFSTCTIEYNDINGGSSFASPANRMTQAAVYTHANGRVDGVIIRGNRIRGYCGDGIDVHGDNILIELNRFEIGGWGDPSAHMDQIQLNQTSLAGLGGAIIQDNYFDMTPTLYTYGRTSSCTNNTQYGGIIYRRNIFGMGAQVPDNGGAWRGPVIYSIVATSVGLTFTNNVFDFSATTPLDPSYGYPFYGCVAWSNNYYYPTGALIPQPT